MALVRLTSTAELPAPGQAKEFACPDRPTMVCVANVNGNISALDNVCVHRGGPLGQGYVEDGKVVCPWHGWHFDAQTGQVGHNPDAKTTVYPLKVTGHDVLIDLEATS
jgi:nitrite reductase (NADH) small subunit